MGNHKICPVNNPKLIFSEGVIMGHHFWQYGTVLPKTNFTFQKFITCLTTNKSTTQTNKSVLNWMVLILIKQNIISKKVKSRFFTKQDNDAEIDFIFDFGSI